MGDAYRGSSVVQPQRPQPPQQQRPPQPRCSIAAFTSPSVLKALKQMADNAKERTGKPNSTMNLPVEERDSDSDPSSSGNSSRSDSISTHQGRFLSVNFAPEDDEQHHPQTVSEKGTFPFDDALSSPPSPLQQQKATTKTSSKDTIDEEKEGSSSIEAQIANEIASLSEHERQLIENDVRGNTSSSQQLSAAASAATSSTSTSRPPHLSLMDMESLDAEFRNRVQNHPANQILIPALQYDYVKDPQLRLKMLVAEEYNCERAAVRLINFLLLLHETFGPYLLARPIQLVDLSIEERQLQRRGLQQLFKFRDHSGRRILGCFDAHNPPSTSPSSLQSQLRVILYLIQVAADDDETQKHGLVIIFMLLSSALRVAATTPTKNPSFPSSSLTTTDDASSRWNALAGILRRTFDCAPIKISAMHICSLRDEDMETVKSDLLNGMSRRERLRCRFHNGSSMELSMALNEYGIPTDRLPLKYDGSVKVEDHLQWIAVREAKEEAFRQGRIFEAVECPMNMDILSGRGQLVRSHPGNISFRQDFIQARSAKYNAAHSRDEKNEIASDILRDIAASSRRFLKQHPSGYWTELERKVAKEKVMMAFREYRKSQKLEATRQSASAALAPPPPSPLSHYPPPPASLPPHGMYPYQQYPPYPPYHLYPPNPQVTTSGGMQGASSSSVRRSDESPPSDGPEHKRHKTGDI